MSAASRVRLAGAWSVLKKEFIDALRDRRTLAVVLLSSVAMGPLVLVLLSGLVSSLETRAERRVVVAVGMEHAPTLANFIERQSVSIEPAPADYEAQLRKSRLGDPVLVVPGDFESQLARGEVPVLELVSDSANRQAEAATRRVERLVEGFNRERGMLALALRGISGSVLQISTLNARDLASQQSRAAQFTGMLPFFVIMAVLYGALGAALDTTAGERERGSLEPLLATPTSPLAITLGKWGAVASLAMGIALLSVLSFLPAQGFIASETLRSLFQFGLREAVAFLMVLVPLAAALSALMMAVAIRCKSFKEAQASNSIVILAVSLLPVVAVFNPGGEQRWFLAVPALAQSTLMNRVLRGEGLGLFDLLLPLVVAVLLTTASLVFIARRLRLAAAKA
ncbi:MAG: hypothetical protein RLZZ598_258 [Pseudomonadota bacterium]|jgi:sodium transport system permease protein